MQIKSWLEETRAYLQPFSQNPGLDAQILLTHELGQNKAWIIAHSGIELSSQNIASLKNLVNRAMQGEPIPYLIGHWEFYALDFMISNDVLIPRPETELMVERALRWLSSHPKSHHILDMGTGSGCVAVTLAVHNPDVSVDAVDVSSTALDIVRKNASKFHVENRIGVINSDLFQNVTGRFDLICANLPYIPTKELSSLQAAKFEPHAALDGGTDGLAIISRFLENANRFIYKPGLILCEFGIGEEASILKLVRSFYSQDTLEIHKDLQGISRLLSIMV